MSESQSSPPPQHHVPSAPGPSVPLSESYTYHSATPTASGSYILGVDEAGRGPVLGPMVYGVAYCPAEWADLEDLGFADSKVLTHEVRASLLDTLCSDPEHLGWSVRVISPQAISDGMLRRPPVNLNQQARDATILLIRDVLKMGITLSEVFVDALGATDTYQAFLSSQFPGIGFTVKQKADSIYKIVGAASVAAKVTRDACIDGWVFEEANKGVNEGTNEVAEEQNALWSGERGSGYPSDPKTKAWIEKSIEPTFGYPSIVRFSWTTAKVALEKHGHPVKWTDEGQATLVQAFESAKGREKDRCAVARDLGIKSVGDL